MYLTQNLYLAILAILPIVLFSVFQYYESSNRSSWKGIISVLLTTLIVMAFFYYILEDLSFAQKLSSLWDKQIDIDSKKGNTTRITLNHILLALMSFLPILAYLLFIKAFDSKKAEPLPIVLFTVLLGIVAAIVIIIVGFPLFLNSRESGITHYLTESLDIGFLRLAVPAESIKWLFLFLFLRMNPFYDEYIDGIVYSVCLSLGYATVLCTWFISDYTDLSLWGLFRNGMIIALILIPIYFMSGTSMGYFFALARNKNKVRNYCAALIVPIVINGTIISILALMGGLWGSYMWAGIILSILSIVFYIQIVHLSRLDGININ